VITPTDFWLIEAYVFFSNSLFPHFSCTIALMAFSLLAYLKYLDTKKWSFILWVALAVVLSQLLNPIAFSVVAAAILFASLVKCIRARRLDLKE
jgi:hypothetical protein